MERGEPKSRKGRVTLVRSFVRFLRKDNVHGWERRVSAIIKIDGEKLNGVADGLW